jgi:hypothetical protein
MTEHFVECQCISKSEPLQYHIKMNVKGTGFEGVDWAYLDQDRNQ